jgi:CheY-like chemotaxis protein
MKSGERILIVDDDKAVLFILQETFSRLEEKYQVVSSKSGREALEQLAKAHYDLVVTDLKMPDIDGMQLTEAIRSKSPATAVIWLTAYGCEKVQEDATRLRVQRCINKPVRTSEIVRTVRKVLEDARGSGPSEHKRGE